MSRNSLQRGAFSGSLSDPVRTDSVYSIEHFPQNTRAMKNGLPPRAPKRSLRRLRAAALSVAAAVLAAACLAACGADRPAAAPADPAGPAASGGDSAEGGSFVFGLASEVFNFDPFQSATADSRAVCFNIYEGLAAVTPEGGFVPALAESWEMNDDATQFTFHLRDGVKFHDGSELDAADVVYSLQQGIDAGAKGYGEITSFEAEGDDTVVIGLSASDPGFIAYMTTAVVPEGAEDLASHPVGTGKFVFGEYEAQDHVTLLKNSDYWGEPAHLDSVTVKFVTNSSELLMNFQAGTIDGFDANAGVSEQLDKDAVNMYSRNSNAVQLMALNNSFGPFQDVRVRQAICYAVDRDDIIETVNYGYGVRIGTGLIPALSKYYDDSLDHVYDTDIEKAKALLAEAGYPDGISFTVTVPSNYQVHIDTAQVLVNQLAKAGITMDIKEVDWATWLDSVYKGRNYEATIISFDGSPAFPTAFLARYQSDSGSNLFNFASAEYDETYAAAVAELDDAEQVRLFKKCQQILTEEAAAVYIEDIGSNYIYSKDFEGFVSYPLYAYDFSVIRRAAQ